MKKLIGFLIVVDVAIIIAAVRECKKDVQPSVITQTNYITITNWVTLVEDSNPTTNIKPGDVYTSLSSNNIWKAEVVKVQAGWVEFKTNSGKETYMMRIEMFLKLYVKEIN
jgi:hypothetical protein